MAPCTVFACESQPIIIEGLRSLLGASEGFQLVGHSQSLIESLEPISVLQPRIVVLDQANGWREIQRFLEEVKRVSPQTRPVIWGQDLTASESYRSLQAGARGAFNRTQSLSNLLECMREVNAGRVWMHGIGAAPREEEARRRRQPKLTPREREIVRLVAQGLKNREIAEDLRISPGTVKVHLMHVFEKTGFKDRFQLSAQARGLLESKGER